MIISPVEGPSSNLFVFLNSYNLNLKTDKNPSKRLDPARCFLFSHCAIGWIVFFTLPLCSLSLGLHHHKGDITSLGLQDAIPGNTILQKAVAWKLWFIHFIGAEVLVNLGRWQVAQWAWGGMTDVSSQENMLQRCKTWRLTSPCGVKSTYIRLGKLGIISTLTFNVLPAIFAAYVTRKRCVPAIFCLKLLPSWLLFASQLRLHHLFHSFPHHCSGRTKTLHHFPCSLTPLQRCPSLVLPLMPGTF